MKLVIFDVDGTLIFSEKRDSLAFAAAYEKIYRQFTSAADRRGRAAAIVK